MRIPPVATMFLPSESHSFSAGKRHWGSRSIPGGVRLMRETYAMATVRFSLELPALLGGSFAPLATALSVYIFADVAGRVLRKRARKLCAEVRPAGAR